MKTFYWFGIYLLLGLWLLVSPYALGFVENLQAYWNAIGSGAVSLVIALAGMYCEREQAREHGFSQKTKAA
jgi:SPW repeat